MSVSALHVCVCVCVCVCSAFLVQSNVWQGGGHGDSMEKGGIPEELAQHSMEIGGIPGIAALGGIPGIPGIDRWHTWHCRAHAPPCHPCSHSYDTDSYDTRP